ncbi:MAG: GLPGLI family protein [Cytophagia bacterium]|nr:MAG: GLPGLI family protein [Runella sp.]TAG17538.1 MAG: GLPGLI family protein [Cytophagales bacterium]TAG36511.1 MAG: GLPGLI family protein [Cytophagia bacterium]TAG58767.1 MAG: GLPGLI family protein [Runella slithyformis]TAG78098.1 MAG: GLPGLI family protein [Cytophagales bacterium]
MKKNILVLFLSVGSWFTAFGQQNEGIVAYDQKINMHKRITDESMKAMIPEFRTNKMQLIMRGGESVFKAAEQANEETESASDNGNGTTMRIVVKAPQSETYRNSGTQQLIELRELAGQKFLIEDTLRRSPWKLTGERKKIQGYDCMQAIYTSKANNQPIVAWFTEAIAVSSGPANYGGLPGLILEVNINDGDMVYLAQKIEFKKLAEGALKVPSGGKKITDAEFTKKRDDYMKEMNMSGGGVRIIRN